MNEYLSRIYKRLGDEKKAKKLKLCANHFVFADGNILEAMYCQLRLCPVCSWRRADKTFHNIFYIIFQPEFKDLDFVFITLTVRNCSAADLQATLDMMNKGWNRLVRTRGSLSGNLSKGRSERWKSQSTRRPVSTIRIITSSQRSKRAILESLTQTIYLKKIL